MKLYRSPLVLAVLAAFASAPTLRAAQQPSSKPDPLASKVAALEKTVEDLQVQRAVDSIRNRLRILDCASREMAEIQPSKVSLVFFLSCVGIEPYLEGYRVTVHIGNPYVTGFSGVSLKLFHGKDMAEALRENRHVKVSLPNPLASGVLTPVVFIVNRASAEQLRHMSVEMDVGVVSWPPQPGP